MYGNPNLTNPSLQNSGTVPVGHCKSTPAVAKFYATGITYEQLLSKRVPESIPRFNRLHSDP